MGFKRRIARLAGLLAVLALLWPMGCGRKDRPRSLEGVPVVRVRLLQDQNQVTLNAARPPTAFPDTVHSRTLALPKSSAVHVRMTPDGWRVGDELLQGPTRGPGAG